MFLLYSQVETGDSDRGVCEECFFVQPEGLHNPSSGSCTFYQRCTPSSHYLFGCLVKITSYMYNCTYTYVDHDTLKSNGLKTTVFVCTFVNDLCKVSILLRRVETD